MNAARRTSPFAPTARQALRGAATAAAALSATLAFAAPVSFNFNSHATLNGLNVDGFVVSTTGSAFIGNSGNCSPACAFNGTNYALSMGAPIGFARADGALFDLSSFDGAETHMNSSFIWARQIRVVGEYADGSTVSTDFLLDGVNDAAGRLVDFQAFNLSSSYSGLRRVSFNGVGGAHNYYALDNVRFNDGQAGALVDALPEPGSLTLAGLALLGALATRRGQTRSRS